MIKKKQKKQKKQKETVKVVSPRSRSAATARPTRAIPGDLAITPIPIDSPSSQPVKDAGGSGGAQTSPNVVIPAPARPAARLVPATPGAGNGGGRTLQIGISSPRPNDAVVGASPGVPVSVSGTTLVDPTTGNEKCLITVSLGGNPSPSFQVNANDGWDYQGITAKGGNISIVARMYIGAVKGPPAATASVAVTVNNNPALSSTITSPANGATIQTWLGHTRVTGSATFYSTINSPQVLITLNGGPQFVAPFDGPGTASGAQVNYTWTYQPVFAVPGGTVQIQATAVGTFTDSQGVTTPVQQQNPAAITVNVQIDTTPPAVAITNPPEDFQTPDDPNGARISVSGTAMDSQSGVQSVSVLVDGGSPVPAQLTPAGANTWAWSAVVTLPPITAANDRGQRIIKVLAIDNANNPPLPATVTVYLETVFRPIDQNDSLSLLAYLGDLVSFATGPNGRIFDPTKNPPVTLEPADLSGNFYQPFDRLSADEEVRQTRLCIEVLRKGLPSLSQGTPAPSLADAEAAYRLSAYETLLLKLGTSYQELRLARAADDTTRKSLAARLGIDLETSRPDKLDNLVLQPSDITEVKLEQLFGLIDTTGNPLSPPSQDPYLLAWQKSHLRSVWTQQDYSADADANFPVPLIDPDLLAKDDFVAPSAGSSNAALDLFNDRTTWVAQQLQNLVNDRQPPETDQARLARLVGLKLAPVAMSDLLNFKSLYSTGTKIDAKLSPIPLSFAAFSYLIRLYNLAAGQPLLADEWSAAYSILVQVLKARQFLAWRAQEANPAANSGPITIDPRYFQLNLNVVTLPEWRATAQARSIWQSTLTSRIGQLDILEQALQMAVDSTEESALPQLRDALLAAIKIPTTVSTLFSTGMVAGSLTLSDKAIDPHWAITAAPPPSGAGNFNAYATINKTPVGSPWLANSATSRWISPQADESVGDPQGPYTYKTTFDLTGFDLASVRIGLQVAVDNDLTDVRLNGQSLGLRASGYAAFVTLAPITNGFVSGINTLEFVINNQPPTPNPSGLRVEFTSNGIAQADANWLSERLLIDVETSGAIKTTRVSQAIETIQGILFSVRTGRFAISGNLGNIASWKLRPSITNTPDTDFDTDWTWMGTYATWRAAMEVFLFPENALSPSYRQTPSGPFQAFLKYLRDNQPLTTDLPDPPNVPGALGLLSTVYNFYSVFVPPDGQATNWANGVADIKNLILGVLSDGDLQTLRDTIEPALYNAFSGITPGTTPNPQALTFWSEVFYFVPVQLALQLQLAGRFEDALSCLSAVYAFGLPEKRKIFYGLFLEEAIPPAYARSDIWLRRLEPHEVIAPTRPNTYSRFTLMSIVRCFLDFADSEFTRGTAESVPQARELYLNALELLSLPEMQPLNTGFQPNPVPAALKTHALNNLAKMRNGLNIAGAQRSGNPSIASGTGSQFGLQLAPSAQPTPYRYATLVDKAKQLVQLAQQVENSYFAALQQQDSESYNLQKANQDLELAGKNVELQALQVTEANDGVSLAKDQKARAQTQYDAYDGLIKAGPLQSETDMIQQYQAANEARNWVARFGAAVTAAQAITTACSGSFGIAAGLASAGSVGLLAIGQAAAQIAANNAESQAQIDSAYASFERRSQEWQLQKSLAQNDLGIGQDQINLASDKVDIANKQQDIANIQDAHAKALVHFLATKFTNVELYEWMSGVLGGVYHYFLQQATAMALLAENQLSFERQQSNLTLIKTDYWQPPTQSAPTPSGGTGAPTDARGLTGSARLLEDITQLDQYAFLTDSRKLQLTKTISLARLAPFEFQRFRETGVLPFVTPMTLFDQDFPGHYLRLIKRVRVSVVALIPPNQGIKARLATTGISRVTLGGDVFQTIAVQRNPELLALTSPMNANGLFELDAQPELLLPFEGTGVDTSWEFRMPIAANLFDYSTIADVLLTMDYTALDSPDYRALVIRQLEQNISFDRAFSFRQEFADQWYDLNNPDQFSVPFSVQFSTAQANFPPNIDNLAIQNILLHFVHADNQTFEISNVSLTLGAVGGLATSIDSTISTRGGNASAWVPLVGKSPLGDWTFVLPDTPDTSAGPGTRTLFKSGAIQDILFVLTYSGKLPAWDTL